MRAIITSLAVMLFMAGSAAGGNFSDADQLAQVTSVDITVIDGVEDSCLQRPNALRSAAELVMR